MKRSLTEAAVRKRARTQGFTMKKSRSRSEHWLSDDRGMYMLVDDRNYIVLGERFDADLLTIASYIDEEDYAKQNAA